MSNTSGLNLAQANTFRQLNAGQKIQLQNDFSKLYGSLETRNGAQTILNYMMVKDGLQLKFASLLEAISPFQMTQYLDKIPSVKKALQGEKSFESTFGISKEELIAEFKEGYLESNLTGPKLVTYTSSPIQPFPSEVKIDQEGVLTIAYTDPDSVKDYVRTAQDDVMSMVYTTYKLENAVNGKATYKKIQPAGSNQQTAIGFMFGDRPTYQEVRQYIRNKNEDAGVFVDIAAMQKEAENITFEERQVEDVLKNESSIIEANEKEVKVKMDVDAESINIADLAGLAVQRLDDQEAENLGELEGNIIEDVDQSMPEMSPEEQQLSLDLQFELADNYDILRSGYNSLMQDRNNKIVLIQNNLFPLSTMIETYESRLTKDSSKTSEENQQEFIDEIKRCLLK